jgi:hypothetical protein
MSISTPEGQTSSGGPVWVARFAVAVAALVVAFGGLAASARAKSAGNTVTEWNAIAATATIATAAQPPHVAPLSLGMVQGAVYDAVNAIEGGHRPYLAAPEAAKSDSKRAAAATAAYRVLVGFPDPCDPDPSGPCELRGLFPTQQPALQELYDDSLEGVPDRPAKAGGIAVGEEAAVAMLEARKNDGRFGDFKFVEGFDPGEWRKTPPNFGDDPAPWVGNVDPFLVPNVEMLRSEGPNALTSAAYAEDFNEVKEVGSLTSTTRTADQTAASIFWQDSGIAIWNRVFSALAAREDLNGADSARLLAATNLAGADGSIGCWNDKYYWNFWRPITAIREAGSDGNPATEPDPAWLPLFDPSVSVSGPPLITPGFPDHPSGHTCISGAFVHTLKAFFETDRIAFTAQSNKCPAPDPIPPTGTCPPRSFDRFSEALEEIVDARVWSGIHFRTADVQGAVLGKEVAHWLDKRYFQPVK